MSKENKKVAEEATVDTKGPQVRKQPSDEELAKKRQREKTEKQKELKVRTASGGDMWDPEAGNWIEGKPTLTVDNAWIRRQIAAKKIILIE